MKTITLSGEQREQLLEMAKVLFPEYNFGFQNDYEDVGIMEYYPPANGLGGWKFIHWFEFCTGYLFAAILKSKQGYRYYRETMEDYGIKVHNCLIGVNNVHPIDYAYEEFKRLIIK